MHVLARILLAIALGLLAIPAQAQVTLSFHSFNGSVLVGRYPHAFVALEGTLDETGDRVNENYGFTAKKVTPAVLRGPVHHAVTSEKPEYIARTNRHFSIAISDAQYHAIIAEIHRWRDAPGKFYDLDKRNCIHFVGTLARMVGLTVTYPENMLRRPKKWLNHLARLNPQLGAAPTG